MEILRIIWSVEPDIFSIGPLTLRWYSLMFVIAFVIGRQIMLKTYKDARRNTEDLEELLIYMIVAVIIGARLGHCLFYQPDHYLANPLEILKVWEGGLASHGAAVGILTALYIYSQRHKDQPYLWLLDRITITIALGGAFVRIGNLMNSEIVGEPTDLPWGFVFVNCRDCGDLARHPSQLYESIIYFIGFLVLWRIYHIYRNKLPLGRVFGWFLIFIFGSRIIIEMLKENQVGFEAGMTLNMGQILSIPLAVAGIILLYRSYTNPQLPDFEKENQNPEQKNESSKDLDKK